MGAVGLRFYEQISPNYITVLVGIQEDLKIKIIFKYEFRAQN